MPKNDEYYRQDYIDFINRLMLRMRIDALREMVDVAMDKIDTKEG